jgi:DNA-binding PadR family transcriptional regulator
MSSDSRPLNATAASLLGFLHERPMTGWELLQVAEAKIGPFWSLTRSQVYRELTAMEGAGLIVAGEVGPRDRRPYRITRTGRAAFKRWLQRDPEQREQVRYPLLLTMAFANHLPPARLAEIVARHRAVHEERLAGYQHLRAQVGRALDDVMTATLDFGIRYESAVLEWFDNLPESLQPGPEGNRGQ